MRNVRKRAALAALATFLGALGTVWYLLFFISATDDREWLAWRRVYTSDELQAVWQRRQQYPLLLLVVVGKVYDVSTGREYYADGSYEGFASGHDHSRAFLSADFEQNATDDLAGLSGGQILGIEHWVKFYEHHATYAYLGVHEGRYYDARGRRRAARYEYERNVGFAEAERDASNTRVLASPRCATRAAKSPSGKGVWKTHACEAPRVPRWAVVEDVGRLCICIAYDEGDEVEPEEQELPHKYRSCAADATECTVRTG